MNSKICYVVSYSGRSEKYSSLIGHLEQLDVSKSVPSLVILANNESNGLDRFCHKLFSILPIRVISGSHLKDPLAAVSVARYVASRSFQSVRFWDAESNAVLRMGRKIAQFIPFCQSDAEWTGDWESSVSLSDSFSTCLNRLNLELVQRFRTSANSAFQIPDSSTVLVVSGAAGSWQAVKDVIWAIDLVSCVRDDVVLVVLGDGPELEDLRLFAKQANVSDKVYFAGEAKGDDFFRDDYWVASCDAFVNVNHRPNREYFYRLALATGRKVVSYDSERLRTVAQWNWGTVEEDGNQQENPFFSAGELTTSSVSFFPAGDRAEMARCILDQVGAKKTLQLKTLQESV